MGNFSDYIKSTNLADDKINAESKNNNEKLEQLIDDYSKLSDDDLMREFLKLTIERKKQGNLNDGELEILKNTIMPYLDEKQINTLENILEMIKNV